LFLINMLYCSIYIALGLGVLITQRRFGGLSEYMLLISLMLIGVLFLTSIPNPITYLAFSMAPYTIIAVIGIIAVMNFDRMLIKHILPVLIVLPIFLLLIEFNPHIIAIIFCLFMFSLFVPINHLGSKAYIYSMSFLVLSFVIAFLGYIEYDVIICTLASLIEGIIALRTLYNKGKKTNINFCEDEVRRKLTHLLAFIILIPLLWMENIIITLRNALEYIDPNVALVVGEKNILNILVVILGTNAVAMFTLIEFVRIWGNSALIPPNLLRRNEMHHIASYVYTLSATLIVAMLFSQTILVISIFVGLMADAMAALIGKRYGKIKLTRNRTLEGTLAGFITAFVVVILTTQNVLIGLAVGFAVALFDASNIIELNDNIVFPILSALILNFFPTI